MKNNPKVIADRGKLLRAIKGLKKSGKKIVFTNGCYDILHVGHVRFLAAAKKLGDVLLLALNSDASVKRIKGPKRPVLIRSSCSICSAEMDFVSYWFGTS